jgi:hypothetical protein
MAAVGELVQSTWRVDSAAAHTLPAHYLAPPTADMLILAIFCQVMSVVYF